MDAYASGSTLKKKPRQSAVLNRLYELSQSNNIAEELDEKELSSLGRAVCEEFQIDLTSRSEWEETAKKAMDVALQVSKAKNYPFANASNVKWPLLLVAASQFNARAYPEICSSKGIVKAKVIGNDEGEPEIDPQTGQQAVDQQTGKPVWKVEPNAKAEKAERIAEYMSYQLTDEMSGWQADTDVLLMQLPIIGDVVKKVYYTDEGVVSEMIPALDFVVNQSTKSLKKCPRMTHRFRLYPYEIEERKNDGRYLDVDYPGNGTSNDKDAPHELLEQHRRIDLDKDGYPEPYIVTVHKDSEKVCRIVANYEGEDIVANDKKVLRIEPAEYFVNYIFLPDPKGGFYGIGFGQLLAPISAAIDTTFNQMLDAGHLQNSGGGFIGSGIRLKKAILRMEPGVYHSVPSTGDNLRNAIVNMEHPGPSPVLFQLLGLMIEAAKDITAVKDILTGDSPQGETATTTLARIEQGLKVFTAIYKRVYDALKEEFRLIFKQNAKHLSQEKYFNVLDTVKAVEKSDFDIKSYDVCPVADPSVVTDMQRLKKADAVLQTAQINQGGVQEILKFYYNSIGLSVDEISKLVPEQQGPSPAEQLQLATIKAELDKTGAETQLTEAKTQQTEASVPIEAKKAEQEDQRLGLAGMQAVDQMQQHDDHVQIEHAGMVLDQKNKVVDTAIQQQNKETDTQLARENMKAKDKGQAK